MQPIWLTLRLVGFGILFVPTFCNLLTLFLPESLAGLFTGILCVVLGIVINDWLLQDTCGKRFLKVMKGLFR